MTEQGNLPPLVLEQKTRNFIHAFSQVLLCLEQFQKNGGLPLVVEITTDNIPRVLVINERFIQTINTGAERLYRELCEAGKEAEANQIMNDLRTYTEETL